MCGRKNKYAPEISVFVLRKVRMEELRETSGNIHLYFFQFPVGLP